MVAATPVVTATPANATVDTVPARTQRAADNLVSAVLDRLDLASSVAAAKRVNGAEVDDPVREAQAAEAFLALVEPHGIDATTARDVITAQFEASKSEQRALLAQWQARPDTIPAGDPPNLVTQVRPAIDATTHELAAALVASCRAGRRNPFLWESALQHAAMNHRQRWRWQREALGIALAPVASDPCPGWA